MPIIKNICAGDRGAYLNGELIMVAPGKTTEADDYPTEWFEVVDGADEPETDVDTDLTKMTVAELKSFAEANVIDLGDAEKKADILAAIELALEDQA